METALKLETDLGRLGLKDVKYVLLPCMALTADLLTPLLISNGLLPAYTRWVSHVAVAAMMIGAYVRMMVFDQIPRAVWAIAWLSAVGIGVALMRGQSVVATAWGWWVMFQYPFVALYTYTQRHWPEQLPRRLSALCTVILGAEVLVQIGQYSTGELPGDNLSGTFGRHGVSNLMLFVVFVLCVALGEWLADGKWRTLVLVLALGSISSALGEMKLFPFAVLMLGIVALALYSVQRREARKLVQYAVLIGGVICVFFGAYDAIVLPARGTRPLESYLELQTLDEYLGGLTPASGTGRYYGRYYMGRNYALTYGWNEMQRDTATFLFGLGLGARGESRTLGTAGIGLLQGDVGLSTGTSLLVMMQELGLLGMAVLGGLMLWTVKALFKGIRSNPDSDATKLRYALLLFTVLWPLWVWYHGVWGMRVPMLLYWATLGYVLSAPEQDRAGSSSFLPASRIVSGTEGG